ncbi:hypothetical protein DL770_002787 [Monosporascus sp. CRB-9-2]|nr:hypothetical protein DL770_002787 [Monosporascus sp. CRB-9-2]
MEEVSPYTQSPTVEDSEMVLNLAVAYPCDGARNGGQSLGPFEEMRRCMTELDVTEAPLILPPWPKGLRKGSSSKKGKRRWIWPVGNQDGEDGESGASTRPGRLASGNDTFEHWAGSIALFPGSSWYQAEAAGVFYWAARLKSFLMTHH